MKINQAALERAVDAGVLQHGQDRQLWEFLQQQQHGVAQFRAAHLLYYLVGLLAISAMSLLMTLSHGYFGGAGIAALACGYGLLGFLLAEKYRNTNLPILTGIFATFALCRYRLPFLLMPVALTLWCMGMDMAPIVLQDFDTSWQMRKGLTAVH